MHDREWMTSGVVRCRSLALIALPSMIGGL
jgi:hypothetical protein